MKCSSFSFHSFCDTSSLALNLLKRKSIHFFYSFMPPLFQESFLTIHINRHIHVQYTLYIVYTYRYCTYGQQSNSYSTGATPLIYDYIWYKAAKGRWASLTFGKFTKKIFQILRSVSVEQFEVLHLKSNSTGKSFSNHEAVEATVKLMN